MDSIFIGLTLIICAYLAWQQMKQDKYNNTNSEAHKAAIKVFKAIDDDVKSLKGLYHFVNGSITEIKEKIETMPMKKGSSQKTISSNIKEGMDSFKRKGTFGNSKPKSAKAAQKQIIAAAYSSAGKSKTKSKKK